MKASEIIAQCEEDEYIYLVVHRAWRSQKTMKLLPGGKIRGEPVAKVANGTLVRFKSEDVKKELGPFAEIEKYIKENNVSS